MEEYIWAYLFVGFLVSLIAQTILFIQGKDGSISGFILDLLLWPVVVGLWVYKASSDEYD